MEEQSHSEHHHHHEHHRHSRSKKSFDLHKLIRKPLFQISALAIGAILVYIMVLIGQKQQAAPIPIGPTTNLPVVIDVSQAYVLYSNQSAYFLDVREKSEWTRIHIPGATLLPLGQLQAVAANLPSDKPIIVFGTADSRAQQARDIIRQSGNLSVSAMADGIFSWKEHGFPTQP